MARQSLQPATILRFHARGQLFPAERLRQAHRGTGRGASPRTLRGHWRSMTIAAPRRQLDVASSARLIRVCIAVL